MGWDAVYKLMGLVDCWADKWIDGGLDGMYKSMGLVDCRADEWIDGLRERWMERYMDEWVD